MGRLKNDPEPLAAMYECPACGAWSGMHQRADDLPETHPDFTLICVARFAGLIHPACPKPEWQPNQKP
jgi:hypothetical protein